MIVQKQKVTTKTKKKKRKWIGACVLFSYTLQCIKKLSKTSSFKKKSRPKPYKPHPALLDKQQ